MKLGIIVDAAYLRHKVSCAGIDGAPLVLIEQALAIADQAEAGASEALAEADKKSGAAAERRWLLELVDEMASGADGRVGIIGFATMLKLKIQQRGDKVGG